MLTPLRPNKTEAVESATQTRIPLTVVVPTTRPWPALREVLPNLVTQALEVGAEILVVDGNGAALESDPASPLRILDARGCDVFEMRARGIAAARGELVLLAEDHTMARAGMLSELVSAHRGNPEATVAFSAVGNDSSCSAIDRANFLMTFAPFLEPLYLPPLDRSPVPSTVTIKKSALPSDHLEPGFLEYEWLGAEVGDGRAVTVPRALCGHIQSHGGFGTLRIHFQSGRAYGSSRGDEIRNLGRGAVIRSALKAAPLIWRQTRHELTRRPEIRVDRLTLSLVGVLASCNAAGQVVGIVAGPGSSRNALV